ncbi:hypothetical protein DVH24_018125, partial [Malus domestica]
FFTLGFIWRSHQTSIFVPPDFFNNVTIGEASIGWWRGFVLVGMLGDGCCSRSLGSLLFLCWNFELTLILNIFPSLPSTRFFGSSLASGSIETPKLSEFTLEQSHDGFRVSSRKQTCEGVVGVQSGQYRATAESSPECDGDLGRDMTSFYNV